MPEELQRMVRKCLEKDREHRYQTMRDVATDLHNVQHERELLARSAAPTLVNMPAVSARSSLLRHWMIAALAVILLGAISIALYR